MGTAPPWGGRRALRLPGRNPVGGTEVGGGLSRFADLVRALRAGVPVSRGPMIEFRQVTRRFGPQVVLDQVSFRVQPGERVGIVGPNGAGKSTLFALLAGEDETDGGEVTLAAGLTLGRMRQHVAPDHPGQGLLAFAEAALPEVSRLQSDLDDVAHALAAAEGTDREKLLQRYAQLEHDFDHAGGYDLQARAKVALGGLGFADAAFDHPLASFSGGWQTRAELARVLVSRADVLLLDEPSNYLDLPAVDWLGRYLRTFPGTLLLISHDRYLLESLTRITLEVNAGKVQRYEGGWTVWQREREARRARAEAAWKNYQRQREQVERFVDRFRAKSTKASQVQSRVKMLEKMEVPDQPPDELRSSPIRIPDPPASGAEAFRADGLGHCYSGGGWLFRGLDLRVEAGSKVALVGTNGLGKTTLLRILAGRLPPAEGTVTLGHRIRSGYQSQDLAETLPPDETVFRIGRLAAPERITDQQLRSILGSFGFTGEEIHKPAGVLSGGERIRLAFARLFVDPPNLLLLDEPTTHLDLEGRQTLERALSATTGTVVLVSHDVAFVRGVARQVLAIPEPGRFVWVPGGYDYYVEKFRPGAAPPSAEAKKGEAKAAAPATDRKAERKRRAEARQARAGEVRRIRRELERAERMVEQMEAEQARLAAQLADPPPGFDFEDANRRLTTIRADITLRTREWEAAAARLEVAERENG